MVANMPINIQSYRKRKSRSRLLQALEYFYTEILQPDNEDAILSDADELEEFLAEVLADQLVGRLSSSKDIRGMDQQYRQFDQRLRRALQVKMKALSHFESMT